MSPSSALDVTDLFLRFASATEQMVFVWRPTGEMLWVNPAFVRITGMTAEDFAFRTEENPFIHPEDSARVYESIAAFVASGLAASAPVENRFFDIWGRVIHVRTRIYRATWQGTPAHVSLTTVSKPPTGSVPEAETQYQRLVDAAFDGILQVTETGRITYSNRRFHELTGFSHVELATRTLPSLFEADHAQGAEAAIARLAAGQHADAFVGRLPAGGHWLDVSLTRLEDCDRPAVALAIARDITQARSAAAALAQSVAELRQAQKMDSIGRLAGGVAHDFNNLLTVIGGNAELALTELGRAHPVAELLVEVEQAATAAAAVTRQLLAFSRKEMVRPEVQDLNDIVRNVQKLLDRVLQESVELVFALSEQPQTVKVDRNQWEQVLINLAVNARDAMPAGGKLTVTTGNVRVDAARARRLGMEPGVHVALVVSDTGAGMGEDVLARLFEPFFTTKEKGTGLGLAMVRDVVREMGGGVEVRSAPGLGSTFELILPSIAGSSQTTLGADGADEARPNGPRATVVVVEDEASVRALATRIIEQLGHNVHAFSGGHEALEFLRVRDVDLLFTDVVMPGMGGLELAKQASQLRTSLRVLFTSGYTTDVLVHHGVATGDLNFIAKPYSVEELRASLRHALEGTKQKSTAPPAG